MAKLLVAAHAAERCRTVLMPCNCRWQLLRFPVTVAAAGPAPAGNLLQLPRTPALLLPFLLLQLAAN